MCCQKAFLKQNDILWDCIATSMKTAQYLVYSQLMESCFNSFVFLSFLPWCTELILHHGNNYLHMLQHCHRKLESTKFSLCYMHACLESNASLIFVVTNLKKIAAAYQSLIRPTWTGTKKWFHNCQCTFVFITDAVAKESGCHSQMYLGVLLVRSLLIAHWLHPYPQNSKQGSRAGPLYKLQNSNPISNMTPRRPKGWSSNTSCNSNPKYFGYDTGHLKSSTTRNLNLNLNSSTHQESESELFPEQGISVTETNWFPVEGLGLEPEIHSTLSVIVVVVYTNCSRTKKAKNRKEFGL